MLTETTNDYGCLVIDNTSTSEKIEDRVFWYKAEIHENFRMCQETQFEEGVEEKPFEEDVKEITYTEEKLNSSDTCTIL